MTKYVGWYDNHSYDYFYTTTCPEKYDNSIKLSSLACPSCGIGNNNWLKWRNIETLSEVYPIKSPFEGDSHCVCVLCQTNYYIHQLHVGDDDD